MAVKIAPSILSADFMNLQRDVEIVSAGGADMIHFDVMDGHFVPNLTVGVPFVKAMKSITPLPLDVHLMVDNPAEQVGWYLDAGADIVTVHIEAFADAKAALEVLGRIGEAGAKRGISLNPDTPAGAIEPVLPEVDLVLVMSVHPGFGGQPFIEASSAKVAEIAGLGRDSGHSPLIEVDGGINAKTAPLVVSQGAGALVAGNAVFGEDDPVVAISEIRRAAEGAARR